MKNIWLTAGMVLLCASPAWCEPVRLLRGTTVSVCLTERVGSGDGARAGAVPLAMAADLLDGQKRVLIAKGTPVVGFIEDSKGEGAWSRAGKLTFTIEETTASAGSSPLPDHCCPN